MKTLLLYVQQDHVVTTVVGAVSEVKSLNPTLLILKLTGISIFGIVVNSV